MNPLLAPLDDVIAPPVPRGVRIIPVCTAASLGGFPPVPVVIQVVRPLPEFKSIEEANAYYDTEAEMIAKGLFDALPQGTMDRVFYHILKRKLSSYRGVTGS